MNKIRTKKTYKIVSLALTLTLALALCMGITPMKALAETPADSIAAQTIGQLGYDVSGKKVGFSCITLTVEFFSAMSDEFEHFFTSRGAKYTALSADMNPATQVENIENFVTMGMDVLIVFLVDEYAATDALVKARQAGLYVVVIANVMQNADAYDVCVTVDQRESGLYGAQVASDWIDEKYPDAADSSIDVVLLVSTSEAGTVARVEGMRTITNINPKINVYEYDLGSDQSQEISMRYSEQAFLEHPDAKLFLCYGSGMALGADEVAMKQVSDKDDFAIICIDSIDVVLDAIGRSVENGSLIRRAVKLGAGTPFTVYSIVTGDWADKLRDKVYNEECTVIGPDNYLNYYASKFD
ncbi:MAG: sugar ABC transporter substrate-binding protein [Oscillospiraceae bacterium]|jgi:ribose transport system substrate-binding protein|nr:sugar ABC transporter substrate-binding protein [Oscillospiraceae bacterium]